MIYNLLVEVTYGGPFLCVCVLFVFLTTWMDMFALLKFDILILENFFSELVEIIYFHSFETSSWTLSSLIVDNSQSFLLIFCCIFRNIIGSISIYENVSFFINFKKYHQYVKNFLKPIFFYQTLFNSSVKTFLTTWKTCPSWTGLNSYTNLFFSHLITRANV